MMTAQCLVLLCMCSKDFLSHPCRTRRLTDHNPEPDRRTLSAVILQLEPEREPARQHEQHGEKHAERDVHGHEELLRDHQNQEVAEPERPGRLEIRFVIGAAIGARQTRRAKDSKQALSMQTKSEQ